MIEIKDDMTGAQVATMLYNEQLIYSKKLFLFYLRVSGHNTKIVPGEFLIKKGEGISNIVHYITDHNNEYFYKLTFIDGETVEDYLNQIDNDPNLVGDIISVSEGEMMPDTYFFTKGTTKKSIIERAQQAMSEYLDDLWSNRDKDLPYKNKYEALILASMVEKETGFDGERDLIAGVFVNRLNKGMRLQSDPTVAYGLGKKDATKLTRTDLTTDHPYNTYTRHGFPKNPIANPSRESLRVVFFPKQTDYLYFVANGEGGHNFSTNLKDHNIAVSHWRSIQENNNN